MDLSRLLVESENNLFVRGLQALFLLSPPPLKAGPPLILEQAAHVPINFKPNGFPLLIRLFNSLLYIQL